MTMTYSKVERALTVKQPWASLILHGGKDVENRTKPFPSTLDLPCRVGVHAGTAYDHKGFEGAMKLYLDREPWGPWSPAAFLITASSSADIAASVGAPRGYLLGYVTVTGSHHADDCREYDSDEDTGATWPVFCSRWAQDDAWHWLLEGPEPVRPVKMKGALGLWRLAAVSVPSGGDQ